MDILPQTIGLAPHSPFVASSFTASLYAVSMMVQWSMRLITNPDDKFWEVKNRTAPATLTDPAFGKHSFLQTKNMTFHMVENGDKSKPLLLMTHGFPEFLYSWRCVAVDMRGVGDSDKPKEINSYTFEVLADDIKEIITSRGREKCTIIARDIGGVVGWSFVSLYPKMVESYVIMNSVHPAVMRNAFFNSQSQVSRTCVYLETPCIPEIHNLVDDMAWLETLLKGNSSSPYMKDEDYEAYKYNFGKPDAFTFPLNYYRANIMFQISDKLKGKGHTPEDPPGLVLFGTNDPIQALVQKDSTAMMCNTRYVEVAGASHFLQQDDPPRTNEAIWKFFAEIKKERPAKCPKSSSINSIYSSLIK